MGFAEKYSATPFDANNPRDCRSEKARVILTKAYMEVMDTVPVDTGDDLQDVAGGFLVGLVGILAAQMAKTDANHAALRAGIIQLVPWAVDMVRSMDDLPPISDSN